MDADSRKDHGGPGGQDRREPAAEALRKHDAEDRATPRAEDSQKPDTEDTRKRGDEDLREPGAKDRQAPAAERRQGPEPEDLPEANPEQHREEPGVDGHGQPSAEEHRAPTGQDLRAPDAEGRVKAEAQGRAEAEAQDPAETGAQGRWERRAEVPLAVASLLFLGAYAIRVLAEGLSDGWKDLCLAVTLAAWVLFAVDYAVRWRLSGLRLRFVRTHWLDTVVLVLPLLRPLRVVKVYEAVQRRHGRPRLALHARVIFYAGLSTVLLGFAGSLAVYQQERGAPGATMRTFGDALWWTCATLATVGYGDVSPVTPRGRFIAVGIMAVGLALLGAVTGTFASWLLQVFSREDDERPPGS